MVNGFGNHRADGPKDIELDLTLGGVADPDWTATCVPGQGVHDCLWPEDCRLIDEALSKITPTPELRVEVTCPDCGADSLIGMDWSHPDFFGG